LDALNPPYHLFSGLFALTTKPNGLLARQHKEVIMNNKLGYPSMLFVCAGLLGTTLSASAQVCTTTFTDATGDRDWNTPLNWDNNTPDSTDVACILEGKIATIQSPGPDRVCKALIIKRVGSSRGTVLILSGLSLIIHGDATTPVDSVIDGDLNMATNASLKMARDVTIKGAGGQIIGVHYQPYPTIESTDGTLRTLTLIGADNKFRSRSLVVGIEGLTFDVRVDNQAYVVASWGGVLLNEGGLGNGFWIAEDHLGVGVDYGVLRVNKAVTGSGSWLIQGHGEAEIEINAASTNLSGDFKMTNGVFDVNADFTTTGDLDVSGAGTIQSTIDIAPGATATFHAAP